MLFGAVTLQAWCFQALQQIACEKCGLNKLQVHHKKKRPGVTLALRDRLTQPGYNLE